MRIFNRAHVPWAVFVLAASLFAGWIYLGNFRPEDLPAGMRLPGWFTQRSLNHRSAGGTPIGLIFGTISFAIFIFAALLGLHKKFVLWRVGSVQGWMRAHIWLTLLTVPLVLFHCGFRLGGAMTTLLMILYVIVMVSGVYGLFLQHQMPRMMMERLPSEAVYEQIPHIRERLLSAARKLRDSLEAASRSPSSRAPGVGAAFAVQTGPARAGVVAESPPAADAISEATLLEFLDRHVVPYLGARSSRGLRLRNRRFAEDTFRFLNLRVAEWYRPRVSEIQGWCDERRMLDLQIKMQRWLHGWLFVHAPLSFVLLIMTGWHAMVTLFYY